MNATVAAAVSCCWQPTQPRADSRFLERNWHRCLSMSADTPSFCRKSYCANLANLRLTLTAFFTRTTVSLLVL
jgi:hypothetical protein